MNKILYHKIWKRYFNLNQTNTILIKTYLATDPSNIFTLSASAANALTTALIVLLSLPKSSSLCARRFGFLPILFNLNRNC